MFGIMKYPLNVVNREFAGSLPDDTAGCLRALDGVEQVVHSRNEAVAIVG